MVFWRVPEPKTAKTRVHVDLASRTPAEEVARLVALGRLSSISCPGGSCWRTRREMGFVWVESRKGRQHMKPERVALCGAMRSTYMPAHS